MTVQLRTSCHVNVRNRDNGTWEPAHKAVLTLTFEESDPAAITLTCEETPWRFALELLSGVVADLTKPFPGRLGMGDVLVMRAGMSQVLVHLRSPDGEARILVPAAIVAAFTAQCAKAAEAGAVEYDVDAWLDGLLGEGASGS